MTVPPGPSPSELDGLRPEQVAAYKRTAINTIINVGAKLPMDQTAVATAIVFLHKYYAVRSIERNDPFLMSMACLYLGGKVEDSPKSVRDVLAASFELRYGTEQARRMMHDKALYESLREQVFIAERALLYVLNFNFLGVNAHKPLLRVLLTEPLRPRVEELKKRHGPQVAQLAYAFINDSVRTEACLRYSGSQIAVACIWLAMKVLKVDTHIYTERGQLWWVAEGVTEDVLLGVEQYMQQFYTPSLNSVYRNNDLHLTSIKFGAPQPPLKGEEPPHAPPLPPLWPLQAQHAAPPLAAHGAEAAAAVKVEPAAGAGAAAVKKDEPAEAAAAAAAAAVEAEPADPAVEAEPKEEEDDYDDLFGSLG